MLFGTARKSRKIRSIDHYFIHCSCSHSLVETVQTRQNTQNAPCVLRAATLKLALDEHPSTEVRVRSASLVDAHAHGNEVLELVEVLLAALVEIPQLEVLLDEVRVGALGDVVLDKCSLVPILADGMRVGIGGAYVAELGTLLDLLLGFDHVAEGVHHLLDLGLADLSLCEC